MITLILLAFVVFALVSAGTFQVGAYQDDALYINLAHALAMGKGYVDPAFPHEPVHQLVPPLYPLLLTPFLWMIKYENLLQTGFFSLQVISILLVAASLYLFYQIIQDWDKRAAVWITALMAINPFTSRVAILVMSENPYLFLTVLCLYAINRWNKREEQAAWLWLAVAAAGLASITRVIGISIVLALIGYLFFRLKFWRWIFFSLLAGMPVSLWFIRNTLLGQSPAGEYAPGLTLANQSEGFSWITTNLPEIFLRLIPNSFIPLFDGPRFFAFFTNLGLGFVVLVAGALLFSLVLVGCWEMVRQDRRLAIFPLYYFAYCGVLVFTWYATFGGVRYYFPILPLSVLFFYLGIKRFATSVQQFAGSWLLKPGLAVLFTGLLLFYLARNVQSIADPVRQRIPDLAEGTTWLRENTTSDALVMGWDTRSVFLFSQRKVVFYPGDAVTPEQVAEGIRCSPANYVLVQPGMYDQPPIRWDDYTAELLVPALDSSPGDFIPVYESENGLSRVYKIAPSGRMCN